MSLIQALQILGVGEGKVRGAGPVPPTAPAPPRPQGRRQMPAHEQAQMARLPTPVPVAGLNREEVDAMAMAGGPAEVPALEQPSMAIRTQARPGILLSGWVPPSGPAANPSGERI